MPFAGAVPIHSACSSGLLSRSLNVPRCIWNTYSAKEPASLPAGSSSPACDTHHTVPSPRCHTRARPPLLAPLESLCSHAVPLGASIGVKALASPVTPRSFWSYRTPMLSTPSEDGSPLRPRTTHDCVKPLACGSVVTVSSSPATASGRRSSNHGRFVVPGRLGVGVGAMVVDSPVAAGVLRWVSAHPPAPTSTAVAAATPSHARPGRRSAAPERSAITGAALLPAIWPRVSGSAAEVSTPAATSSSALRRRAMTASSPAVSFIMSFIG